MFDPGTKCLKEFIEKMDGPTDPKVWWNLMQEESKEVIEAAQNLLKEITDLYYVATGGYVCGLAESHADVEPTPEMQLASKLVVIFNESITEKAKVAALAEVHRSNLSKLDDNGKPIKREDGKVLKGPNYSPADMGPILEQMVNDLI